MAIGSSCEIAGNREIIGKFLVRGGVEQAMKGLVEWSNLGAGLSAPLDETVDDAFLSGLFEIHCELVAFDNGDVAIAEFLVEDAVAE